MQGLGLRLSGLELRGTEHSSQMKLCFQTASDSLEHTAVEQLCSIPPVSDGPQTPNHLNPDGTETPNPETSAPLKARDPNPTPS